jgi:hypothetical protein
MNWSTCGLVPACSTNIPQKKPDLDVCGYMYLIDTMSVRYEIHKDKDQYFFVLNKGTSVVKHIINLPLKYRNKSVDILLIKTNGNYDYSVYEHKPILDYIYINIHYNLISVYEHKPILDYIYINDEKIKNDGIVMYNPVYKNI